MKPVGLFGLGGASLTIGLFRAFHLLGFGNDGGLGSSGYVLTGAIISLGCLILVVAVFSKNKRLEKSE